MGFETSSIRKSRPKSSVGWGKYCDKSLCVKTYLFLSRTSKSEDARKLSSVWKRPQGLFHTGDKFIATAVARQYVCIGIAEAFHTISLSPATSFSRPTTDFSRRCTATGRRLMSNFLVAASLHINKWSFSHKWRFLRHSTDEILCLMH